MLKALFVTLPSFLFQNVCAFVQTAYFCIVFQFEKSFFQTAITCPNTTTHYHCHHSSGRVSWSCTEGLKHAQREGVHPKRPNHVCRLHSIAELDHGSWWCWWWYVNCGQRWLQVKVSNGGNAVICTRFLYHSISPKPAPHILLPTITRCGCPVRTRGVVVLWGEPQACPCGQDLFHAKYMQMAWMGLLFTGCLALFWDLFNVFPWWQIHAARPSQWLSKMRFDCHTLHCCITLFWAHQCSLWTGIKYSNGCTMISL